MPDLERSFRHALISAAWPAPVLMLVAGIFANRESGRAESAARS
jgi:hypothetical protein